MAFLAKFVGCVEKLPVNFEADHGDNYACNLKYPEIFQPKKREDKGRHRQSQGSPKHTIYKFVFDFFGP